jgi:hypothetical protein
MGLPTDDTDRQGLRNAQVAFEVVGRNRLLQPVNVVRLNLPAHLDGDIGGPPLIHIDHDVDVGAKRLAHAAHVVYIAAQVVGVRHLHLDRLIALRFVVQRLLDHSVAAGAAETTAAIGRNLRAEMPP